MVKKYTYTLLLITCNASVYSQTPTTANKAKRTFIKNEIDNQYRQNWNTDQLKGRVKTIIQYTYNNNQTTDSAAAISGPTEYSYEFDEQGNWTKSVLRTAPEIKITTIRKIIYY